MMHAFSPSIAFMQYEIERRIITNKEEYGRQLEEAKRQQRIEKCCEKKCSCKGK